MTDINNDLLKRAMAAYFRAGDSAQPANDSGATVLGDHQYVVLRNVSGILAVYRVRNDGMLKRLKRWPAELEEREAAVKSLKGALKDLDRLDRAIDKGVKEGWLSNEAASRMRNFE